MRRAGEVTFARRWGVGRMVVREVVGGVVDGPADLCFGSSRTRSRVVSGNSAPRGSDMRGGWAANGSRPGVARFTFLREYSYGVTLRRTRMEVSMTTHLAPDDESSRVAVHEAGHCLSLWRTGPGVDRVEGRATFPLDREVDGRARLWCGLAGRQAEEHLGVQQPSGCGLDDDRVATGRNMMVQDEQARTSKPVKNPLQYDMDANDGLRRLFKDQEAALYAVAERVRLARRSGETVSGQELARVAADAWVGELPEALAAQL